MAEIFISFRGADEPGYAVLLHRELVRAFGTQAVFFASSAIRAGEDFETCLVRAARKAVVLLAVVGPRWLTTPDPSGAGLAVDNPKDWVRREVAEALASGARVIPILIDDAKRLTDARLPPDIDQLRRCQYLRLRHENVDYDLAHIINSLAAGTRHAKHGASELMTESGALTADRMVIATGATDKVPASVRVAYGARRTHFPFCYVREHADS